MEAHVRRDEEVCGGAGGGDVQSEGVEAGEESLGVEGGPNTDRLEEGEIDEEEAAWQAYWDGGEIPGFVLDRLAEKESRRLCIQGVYYSNRGWRQ